MQGREGAAADTTDRNDAPEGEAQPQALGAATVVDVEKELQAALDKANENYDLFLRAKAEADNVRRRAQEDVAKAHKFAVESFAESLVPVVDSLEKALEATNATPEAMREGVELTLRQLKAAFEKGNLKEINPVGEKFDPHWHQAISMVPAPRGHRAEPRGRGAAEGLDHRRPRAATGAGDGRAILNLSTGAAH